MAHPPCTHQTPDGPCDTPATDRYLAGWRCTSHTPAALAGHPEPPVPDPTRTLAGLRAAAGRAHAASPIQTSQLYDDRAVASGRRRASLHEISDARMRLGIVAPDMPPPAAPAPALAGLFEVET